MNPIEHLWDDLESVNGGRLMKEYAKLKRKKVRSWEGKGKPKRKWSEESKRRMKGRGRDRIEWKIIVYRRE